MRATHELIVESDCICAIGNGPYFSWIITPEYGEWQVSTIFGRRYSDHKTLVDALRSIGYERRMVWF